MKAAQYIVLSALLFASLPLWAEKEWTFKNPDFQHDSTLNRIWLSADQPGMGTGSEIIKPGFLQWEMTFQAQHALDMHVITLPASLFRYGVHERVEVRLEYDGALFVPDKQDKDPETTDGPFYMPEPLWVGTKIMLVDHHAGPRNLRGIPRTSVLLNLGLPITSALAKTIPLSGSIDVLAENEVTDWFSLGYDIGVYWIDWAPTPDVFASLGLNFQPTERLGLFLECYNWFDPDAISPSDLDKRYTHCNVNLDFGIIFAVHPRVQLDLSAGFNLYDDIPALSTPKNDVFMQLGVTWLIYRPKRWLKRNK